MNYHLRSAQQATNQPWSGILLTDIVSSVAENGSHDEMVQVLRNTCFRPDFDTDLFYKHLDKWAKAKALKFSVTEKKDTQGRSREWVHFAKKI